MINGIMRCSFCSSEMKYKENEDLLVPIGNPKKIKMIASFYKCEDCGKELLNSQETIRIARELDKISMDDVKLISIKAGEAVC